MQLSTLRSYYCTFDFYLLLCLLIYTIQTLQEGIARIFTAWEIALCVYGIFCYGYLVLWGFGGYAMNALIYFSRSAFYDFASLLHSFLCLAFSMGSFSLFQACHTIHYSRLAIIHTPIRIYLSVFGTALASSIGSRYLFITWLILLMSHYLVYYCSV